MEQIKTKCNGCRCWREPTDFIKNDKVVKTCKTCREYREKNADKINERKKKWRIENVVKLREHERQYVAENKDKVSNYKKKYAVENKDKIKQSYVEQQQNNPLRTKLKNMIKSSIQTDKNKNRTYNEEDFITYEFLMSLYEEQQGKCYYENCNCDMTLDFNKSCRSSTQITVQRLDNEIAHIKLNCVLSCFFCNCMKRMEQYDL